MLFSVYQIAEQMCDRYSSDPFSGHNLQADFIKVCCYAQLPWFCSLVYMEIHAQYLILVSANLHA